MTRFPGLLDSIKNWISNFVFKFTDPLSDLLKQFHCFHCNLAPTPTSYLKYQIPISPTTYLKCQIPISLLTSFLLNSIEDFRSCLTFCFIQYCWLCLNLWTSLSLNFYGTDFSFVLLLSLLFTSYFSRQISGSFSGWFSSMYVIHVNVLSYTYLLPSLLSFYITSDLFHLQLNS